MRSEHRVLICGGGDEVTGWLRALLSAGFRAHAITAGIDALAVLAHRTSDLVVVAGDPGGEQQGALRKATDAQRILVTPQLTAQRTLTLANEADLILPAPVEPEMLITAIEQVLAAADYVSPFAHKHRMSPRETSLVRLALSGMNNDEAAAVLGCSRATVSSFWSRIFRKTRVSGQRDFFILLLRQQRHRNAYPTGV